MKFVAVQQVVLGVAVEVVLFGGEAGQEVRNPAKS